MLGIFRAAALLLAVAMAAPVFAATALQCVPYARIVSGVNIRGDALTWWDQAADRYARGHEPRLGAVLAFRPYGPMTLGHVAVVSKLLGDRRMLIRHANWSVPGAIEEDVLAIDVSDEGDWSAVRVWHSPTARMGARTNPTFGFIYPARSQLRAFQPDPSLGTSVRFATARHLLSQDFAPEPAIRPLMAVRKPLARKSEPRLEMDLRVIQLADAAPSARSIGDIIADVKRDARLR